MKDRSLIDNLKEQISIEKVLNHYSIDCPEEGNNTECTEHNSEGKKSLVRVDDNVIWCCSPCCDFKGDIFNIVAEKENLDLQKDFLSKIIPKVCEIGNIKPPTFSKEDKERLENEKKKEEVIKKSHKAFFELTKQYLEKDKDIQTYIEVKRGITKKQLESLDLGFLPSSFWNIIKAKILKQVPEAKEIKYFDKKGKEHLLINSYFSFVDRIIHPHFYCGNILYLTGEITPKTKKDDIKSCGEKYKKLNARFSVFGGAEGYLLDSLNIDDKKEIIFAEGYWDALKLKLNGYSAVSFGTCKISNYFVEKYSVGLKKFKEIKVIFDTEENESGLMGALSLGKRLINKKVQNVLIGELPKEENKKIDIDDFFKGDAQDKQEEFNEILKECKEIKVYLLKKLELANPIQQNELVGELLDLIENDDLLPKMQTEKKLPKLLGVPKKTFEEFKEKHYSNKREKKRLQQMREQKTFVDRRFFDPQLIEHIWKELDREHKLDHKGKLATFLICVTSQLPDDKDHTSGALKGDSSCGKDNMIKTCLKLFPEEDSFMLTRGTQPAIEDECEKVKIIAFSEINKARDGANANTTEVFKQLAEGGINVIKKDTTKGSNETLNIKGKQKTLLYGTTETESDDELETRYVVIPVKGDKHKNKIVVDDSLSKKCDINYYLSERRGEESWVAKSIRGLDEDIQVIIPFANEFKNKIEDTDGKQKYLFDYNKERIKRDSKRILSLTCAVTWLYQKQRVQFEKEGKRFVYAEPSDFLLVLDVFADFFNLTYSGLDHRLNACHKKILELEGKHEGEILAFGYDQKYYGWVLRHKLQAELGILSVNTIKERIDKLKDLQYVEWYYDKQIPKGYLIKGIKQGINRVSLPISMIALTGYLTGYLIGKNIYNKELKWINRDFLIPFELKYADVMKKIRNYWGVLTPSKLTPSISLECAPKKIVLNKTETTHHRCSGCRKIKEIGCNFKSEDGKYYCKSCSEDNTCFVVNQPKQPITENINIVEEEWIQ